MDIKPGDKLRLDRITIVNKVNEGWIYSLAGDKEYLTRRENISRDFDKNYCSDIFFASNVNKDNCLDFIYNFVRGRIREKKIEVLEDYIKSAMQNEDLDILLAVLTTTLPVKDKLKNRPALYQHTLKLSNEDLLRGLE